jgi:DNA-binding MarR family transcriptional regulator
MLGSGDGLASDRIALARRAVVVGPVRQTLTPAKARQAARLGGGFLVDLAGLLAEAFEGDLVTGVCFLVVARGDGRGDQDSEPAGPIAARALADVLSAPLPTVRRHVRKLRAAGLCESGPTGLQAPAEAYASAQVRRLGEAVRLRTAAFLSAAAAQGLTPDGVGSGPIGASRVEVLRLVGGHFQDGLSLWLNACGLGVVDALVLHAIDVTNAAGLGEGEHGRRHPTSVYRAAKLLALPNETVRRRIQGLIEQGWVERVADGGVVVAARNVASRDFAASDQAHAALVMAFLQSLSRLD